MPIRRLSVPVAIAATFAFSYAQAEVTRSLDDAFSVKHSAPVQAPNAEVFSAMTQRISEWWHPDHSWSGDAANFYFTPGAGGCFCERLPNGGSVEHLHVIYFAPTTQIRFTGALGPLAPMGLLGTMNWRIEESEDGRKLVFEYHVIGRAPGGTPQLAPIVDGVIGQQHTRLLNLLEHGTAEPEPVETAN